MSREDFSRRRRPFGIAAVGIVGSLLLVVVAGVVLWGPAAPAYTAGDGALRGYGSAPEPAWTLDDATLPGLAGEGRVTVDDQRGDDWLVAYPSDYGRAFVPIDVRTGLPRWPEPVRVGLGDCAINAEHRIGCAVKNGDVPDGFYLIDDDGRAQSAGPLDDTASVTAVGRNFLRVNQFGRQASLRTPEGATLWNRSFAATAYPRLPHNTLVVDTADGRGFILDKADGESIVECDECDVWVYTGGAVTQSGAGAQRELRVYPRTGREISSTPVRTAPSLTVVPGPAALPIFTGTGPGQLMETSGRYEVVDPATGAGLWRLGDPELSKVNARPCGTVVSFRMKDDSRRFYTLADGRALGAMAPPSYLDPDHNLNLLSCVGSSGDGGPDTKVLFASRDKLSAFDAGSGALVWDLDINGTVDSVDGYVVLTQGQSITVLAPS